jgi:protein TonB
MFEESLIESTRQTSRTLGGMPLPLSVALHALVIGALVAASLWFVEDVPEPPVPVIFYPPGSPPPLGGDASARSVKPPAGKRPISVSQPIAIPRTVAAATPTAESSTTRGSDAVEQVGDSGDPKGEFKGTGDSMDGGIGPGSSVETAIYPGGDVKPPQLIERVEPSYPEVERKLHKEGIVILEAIITADGTVDEIRVLKSADVILDEAARRAVLQWRYKPATLNGRSLRVYLTVTVSFILH